MAEKTVAVNRKALHDYHVLERLEAGMVLTGTEIKSIRDGRVSIREAYARPEDGELWLLRAPTPPARPPRHPRAHASPQAPGTQVAASRAVAGHRRRRPHPRPLAPLP